MKGKSYENIVNIYKIYKNLQRKESGKIFHLATEHDCLVQHSKRMNSV